MFPVPIEFYTMEGVFTAHLHDNLELGGETRPVDLPDRRNTCVVGSWKHSMTSQRY